MKSNPSNPTGPARRLAVTWRDSVWFPPVQSCRPKPMTRRRAVPWDCQIITDPTVCPARTVTLF